MQLEPQRAWNATHNIVKLLHIRLWQNETINSMDTTVVNSARGRDPVLHVMSSDTQYKTGREKSKMQLEPQGAWNATHNIVKLLHIRLWQNETINSMDTPVVNSARGRVPLLHVLSSDTEYKTRGEKSKMQLEPQRAWNATHSIVKLLHIRLWQNETINSMDTAVVNSAWSSPDLLTQVEETEIRYPKVSWCKMTRDVRTVKMLYITCEIVWSCYT